jgi:hypothetical protein
VQQQQDRSEEKRREETRQERHRKERECKEWKKVGSYPQKEISQKEKEEEEGAWNISSKFIYFHEEK